MNAKPYTMEFPKLGSSEIGYLSFAQVETHIPFDIRRVYWTYFTPEQIVRGGHAHIETQIILVAVAGRITLSTELLDGQVQTFTLDSPNRGVFLPKYCWRTMKYSHNAVQLVISSLAYDVDDYIREYSVFKSL